MTRDEAQSHGQRVEAFIREAVAANRHATGRKVAEAMNREGLLSLWGRKWTGRAVYRFMQRRGLRFIDIVRALPDNVRRAFSHS